MGNKEIVRRQRKFYRSGTTLDVAYREKALKRMLKFIDKNEKVIEKALFDDLGKAPFESYSTEIAFAKEEIRFILKNIQSWTAFTPVKTPLMHFPARSYTYREPLGVVLIISPWNYPFQLGIVPLAEAIAAGNCVMLKPSTRAPRTAALLRRMVGSVFDADHVTFVSGNRKKNADLLDNRFDKIFFTGSAKTGRYVLEKASKYLTPVTLELGGKSPCIVAEDANIKKAAKRIVWGKFLNAGQTCVAPDYVLCHVSRKDELLRQLDRQIHALYGKNPMDNPEYPKLVDKKQFKRLNTYLKCGNVFCGGRSDAVKRKMEPTILTDVTWDDLVMREEIFGPILPVMTFYDIDEVIEMVQICPKSLALYLFTEDDRTERAVIKNVNFGGGCVNDTVAHVASNYMPFGGVGESGMGAYHGKAGFDTFSHEKSILKRGTHLNPLLRCAPYRKKERFLKTVKK